MHHMALNMKMEEEKYSCIISQIIEKRYPFFKKVFRQFITGEKKQNMSIKVL